MHDFTPVRLLIFGYGYVAQHLIEYIKDFYIIPIIEY